MKKILLILLMLIAFGCGNYSFPFTTTIPADYNLLGTSQFNEYRVFDVGPVTYSVNNLNADALSYEIDRNDGGSGTISFRITDLGVDCATVSPTETIQFVAGATVPVTLATQVTMDELNARLNGNYRVCMGINQIDPSTPIDLRLTLVATVSMVISQTL